jgi:endonuclease YncB( thermonuclease family)
LRSTPKLETKVVTGIRRDTDRYGCMFAMCLSGGVDLGGWLVRQSHAIATSATL